MSRKGTVGSWRELAGYHHEHAEGSIPIQTVEES
jgi:hypothetical protein